MEQTNSREQPEQERFSLKKRAQSFGHAGRGVLLFLKTTHNAWLHLFIFIAAIFLGIYFRIAHADWIVLFLASGLVFTAEAFNTAIETDMELTSPEFHPYARDTKDIAAGAVLISAAAALVVGIFIFGQPILILLRSVS